MKKTLFFSFLLVIGSHSGFSQSFMQGAGVGIFINSAPNTDVNAAGVLTYAPRFNFVETEALSVSVGVPFSVGFSGSYNATYSSYYGSSETNTIRFMFNAPLMVNLNIGAGSTKENEKRFGFFAGGGFGYHYGNYAKETRDGDYIVYEDSYGGSYGPAGNIGLRFAVGSHQKNIEAKLSYMKAISESKMSAFGITALFNF